MPNAHIVGWGKYLPGKPLTTADLAARAGIELDDEWVRSRTGIQTRHFVDDKDFASTMATKAARAALEMADLDADKLDLIIVATNSPDYHFPSTACLVQDALGATHAGAFDLVAGCPGFLYALTVADRFIRSGAHRAVLVVGTERVSPIMDLTDKGTCAFFGDGAGAVVLTAGEQPGGLLGFTLGADGSGSDLLILPAGGSRLPLSQDVLDKGLQYGHMDGGAMYRFGLKAIAQATKEALRKANVTLDEIDLFIPHQSNARLIQQAVQNMKLSPEKVFINVDRYANTSTAALPLAICDAVEAGRLHPGDHILFATFGAGLTWAGAVFQWAVPKPVRRLTPWHRAWHGLRDTLAALHSLWMRLVHGVDKFLGGGEVEA